MWFMSCNINSQFNVKIHILDLEEAGIQLNTAKIVLRSFLAAIQGPAIV